MESARILFKTWACTGPEEDRTVTNRKSRIQRRNIMIALNWKRKIN